MKILLATPCAGGVVRHEYCLSLLTETFLHPERLQEQEKYNLQLFHTRGYSGLGKDRGVIASYALRNGYDKLFFIDSDMAWRWKHLKMLLDSDKKIIAGIASIKELPPVLNFSPLEIDKHLFTDRGDLVSADGLDKLLDKYPDEVEVNMVGTAFMCIDVRVLKDLVNKKVAVPFNHADYLSKTQQICWDFFQTGPSNGKYFGEDHGFCAMAKFAGHNVFINPRVQLDHIGDHTYRIF